MTERQVTVGVDGSVTAFAALDEAAVEAARRGARLQVVHCAEEIDAAPPVLRAALARVRERHPGLPVTAVAASGDPADVLAAYGRRAELTVIGSRGLSGFAGMVLHSVSRRLAARTHSPLLVVPGRHPSTVPGRRPAGVLLGVGSDADADAALFAFEEARLRGAGLTVLHAWTYRQPADGSAPAEEEAARQARHAAAVVGAAVAGLRRRVPHAHAETAAVRAAPCRALLTAAHRSELVVVATHPGRPHAARRVGHVTEALLHHARCPVAVVPVP
ncbi:universal stress protein [Actinacidiphila guanduensis]|uniref:Nucleotide-binding universal stress protein, UspA family n=1 Tax=Actinacidiphila guanduensis TaxID=310781 RepID=A0A1G9ZK80_9ACTN|nr:universal stress protein [Actinacidiphila guanduensis]SDN21718.1 Nucleotide-binding universal stress protein, UspA family [Actinacidiphila guanduensis]